METSPIIKTRVGNFAEFRTKFQEMTEKKSANTPFALAGRIGGSTVDFALTGLAGFDKKPAHIEIHLDPNNKKPALDTLIKIISFVSEQAKKLGQKVLPVDLGIAGFTTKEHPVFKGHNLRREPGLHILPNFTLDKSKPEPEDRLINFANSARRMADIVGAELKYQDESGIARITQDNRDFTLDFKVINDTVAIGNSVIKNLNDGENVLTMVCGSGFNVGKLEDFDKKSGAFKQLTNTEVGHETKALSQGVLDLFDKSFIEANDSKLSPEWLFAGGAAGVAEPQGLVAYLESKRSSSEFAQSSLVQLEQLDSKAIVEAARNRDKLAQDSLVVYAKALGKFLNENYSGIITSDSTNKLVITGSHLLDILSIESAREEFNRELNHGRIEEPLIIKMLDKSELDGMLELVKARSADIKTNKFGFLERFKVDFVRMLGFRKPQAV